MTNSFTNQVAVITGGASGIGFALARVLGEQGCRLVLADIEKNSLDKSVADFKADGIEAIGVVTDVSDAAQMHALADRTFTEYSAANFIFHNAGVALFGPTQEMKDVDWKWVTDVNLWGAINGVQAFLPRMLEKKLSGHHVFTASFAGLVPNKNLGPYNVTKAAVVALAESLYKDLRGTGIGSSVLCPMMVESKIQESHRNRPEELGGSMLEIEPDNSDVQGRTLSAEETAKLVLKAIVEKQLYIHTHKEAEELYRRRASRILDAFRYAL